MGKLAIVLLSDMKEPLKVEMALEFALLAKRENRLDDIRFFFFGPGVQAPGQIADHASLRGKLSELLESGIATLACVFNARELDEVETLAGLDIEMKDIGTDLVDMVQDGYQVMTF